MSVVFSKDKENRNHFHNELQHFQLINKDHNGQSEVDLKQNETIYRSYMRSERRHLSTNIDVSQTTVSGLSDFEIGTTKTITAIPRDFSGNPIGGGCDIYIQVSNQCTVSEFDNMCGADTSAPNIVTNTTSLMTYSNDGQSYSHSFTVDKAGPISIFIYAYESSYIKAICFDDVNWDQFKETDKWNDLDKTGYSPSGYGQDDHFSFEFDTYIKGPVSGQVDFYAEYDDGIQIFLGEITHVDNIFNGIQSYSASWSSTLNQDQLVRLRIRWHNYGAGTNWIRFYWSYTGQSQIIIPSSSYYFPDYVGPTIINSYCPYGYSPDSNYNCVETCGDNIKIGNEVCDDGNTGSNDGCSSDCASIEPNWVCSGGNLTTSDTCTFCDNNNGWYQNDPNNPTVCVTQCGDGHESGNEKCDDGNTANGDGCNSDCLSVEDNWVCTGGSETSPDVCVYCNDGYYQDNSTNPQNCITICGDNYIAGTEECDDGNTKDEDGCSSTCKIEDEDTYGPIYQSTATTVTAQTVSATGVCVGSSIAFLNGHPGQDVWAMIHFPQIILIIPLLVRSMKKKVKNFIVSNAFAALAVYSLPLRFLKENPLINNLSFDQPDEYLRILGWSSGSTFVNNLLTFMLLLGIIVLHFISYLLYYFTKQKDSKFRSIILKLYRFFMFSVYIRIFLEIFMFTVLMILSEIKYYIKNKGDDNFGHESKGKQEEPRGNYVSLLLSCILLIFPILFLVLVFISWMNNKKTMEIDEKCKTRELYSGILKVHKKILPQQTQNESRRNDHRASEQVPDVSDNIKRARLYHFMFLIRRLTMIVIIVLIPDSMFSFKISLILTFQTVCIGYNILQRSFDKPKDQAIEIINESVFLILMIISNNFRSESDWTDITENLYIGIILSQIWILFLTSMVSSGLQLIQYVSKCKYPRPEKTQSKHTHREGNKIYEDSMTLDDCLESDQNDSLNDRRVNYLVRENCQQMVEEEKQLQIK